MRAHMTPVYAASLVGLLATACGSDEATKSSEPAPIAAGTSDETFSLESGTYYIETVRDLQDGCGKNPLDAQDSITQVPFILANDGNANVSIDFCSYDNFSTHGSVRGNRGTLSALHHNRRMGSGPYAAEMEQECMVDLRVTADNQFQGRYTEDQRNRNKALRQSTVDVPECTTSFTFTMKKHD